MYMHACILIFEMLLLCIGMFYYALGNLPPHLRSTQRSIQLIACVTSPNIKEYGFEKVLQPFIDDINRLSKVIPHVIHNIVMKVKHFLLISMLSL